MTPKWVWVVEEKKGKSFYPFEIGPSKAMAKAKAGICLDFGYAARIVKYERTNEYTIIRKSNLD